MSVRLIHIYKSRLGMDADTYRAMLQDRFGVESSLALQPEQAAQLAQDIYALIPEAGRAKLARPSARVAPGGSRLRFAELEGRTDDYATPKQLRMLEAAWVQRSRAPSIQAKREALVAFLRHKFDLGGMAWIQRDQVGRILRSITSVRADAAPRRRKTSTTQQPTINGV